jgi:hypothetical protein
MNRFAITIAFLLCVYFAPTAYAQHAPLTEQRQCADAAKREFNSIPKTPSTKEVSSEFTSHYDPKTRTCLILTHSVSMITKRQKDDTVVIGMVLYDVIEGRTFANYMWMNDVNTGKKYWEVAPTFCSVKPRGQDEITCTSEDQFKALIDKYFDVGL